MNIDDKLNGLRKSMTDTFKNMTVDEQKLKQYVLKKSKRNRYVSHKWNFSQLSKTGFSILGIAVLCLFIGVFGLSQMGVFSVDPRGSSLQITVEEEIGKYLSKEEDRYGVLFIYEKRELVSAEWEDVQEEIWNWNVSSMTLTYNFESIHSGFKKQFNLISPPVALVFNQEEMVYKATEAQELIAFFKENGKKRKQETLDDEPDYSHLNIAGIDLGMSRDQIVEQLGMPKQENNAEVLTYKSGGETIMEIQVGKSDRAYDIRAYPSRVESDKWEERLPMNKQDMIEMYGEPENTRMVRCDYTMCRQYQYIALEVTFNRWGTLIERVVFKK